ncbi:MAG: hypothetical protein JXQ73_32655 [Phycisphaerae bacterium]|nr:hypothetical protein [Phycisphaerae bacterium]
MEDKELDAMAAITRALGQFGEGESDIVQRILRWACERYRLESTSASRPVSKLHEADEALPEYSSSASSSEHGFEDLPDLYHRMDPRTDPDRALTVAYWCQVVEGGGTFTGREVNSKLNDLGHRLANITDALNSLMRRKPQLVIQAARMGPSKQSHKRYKLTAAGVREAQSRLTHLDISEDAN